MQGGAFDELAIVQISGKGAGRDGVVAPGLPARDAKSTGEGSQRDLDPRAELGHLALPIEVEICTPRPRNNFIDLTGPVIVIGPRPGQSVRSFLSSSIVRPGHNCPWECDIVSKTTVSPESMVNRGNSALSNQPHCVVSKVAGRIWTFPGSRVACTTMSFCAPDRAC